MSGLPPARMQQRRTPVVNGAPPSGDLLPGMLAVEMASSPVRLWAGVDTAIDASGRRPVSTVAISDTAPAVAYSGDLWWDGQRLYLWYDDGTTQQWVGVSAPAAATLNVATTGTGSTFVLQQSPTINQPLIVGRTDGSFQGAGFVAQIVSNATPSAGVAISPGSNTLLVTTLQPGDWDVWGHATLTSQMWSCTLGIAVPGETLASNLNTQLITTGMNPTINFTTITLPCVQRPFNITVPTAFNLQANVSMVSGVTTGTGGAVFYARRRA